MGWDKGGRYYTRSKRVNGKVVREHIGGGEAGRLAAQQDALEREKRQAERAAERAEQAEIAALDAQMDEYYEQVELLFRAYLMALGYRQHNRGEWRKRRVPHQETPSQGDEVTQNTSGTSDAPDAVVEAPVRSAEEAGQPSPRVAIRRRFRRDGERRRRHRASRNRAVKTGIAAYRTARQPHANRMNVAGRDGPNRVAIESHRHATSRREHFLPGMVDAPSHPP